MADRAGDVYKTDIAKAKEKCAATLDRCKDKPTTAKRKACKQKANGAFAKAKQKAKQKAKAKRDKAREKAGGNEGGSPPSDKPKSPADERDEFRDCLRDGGRPYDCRQKSRRP